MNIFKVGFYSALSQATTIIVGLVAVKILAVEIGPEGVALQSQFLNTTMFFYILSTGAINTGTIKYLAEYSNDKAKQLNIIRISVTICLVCSILFGIVLMLSSGYLAETALMSRKYGSAFLLYGLFLPITGLNFLFSSILNGLQLIRKLTIINIITSISNLFFLIIFSTSMSLYGVLVYMNVTSVIILLCHLSFINNYRWFSFSSLKPYYDKAIVRSLFGFSMMSIFAAFIAPFTQIIVRNKLIHDAGVHQAGEWQTVSRISDFYLSFLTGILSIYLLPKLSSLSDSRKMRAELLRTGSIVMPAVVIVTLAIWLCRDLIIKILLTSEFSGVRDLFDFQLLGDVFKIAGWGLSMVLWAKAQTKRYLVVDSISLVFYLGVTILCINYFSTKGATIGFCISYFVYFLTMLYLNRGILFTQGNARLPERTNEG